MRHAPASGNASARAVEATASSQREPSRDTPAPSTTSAGFNRLSALASPIPRAVAAWLITSARRGAAEHARKARRASPVEDEKLAAVLPDVESAEALAVLDDDAARLWRAVASVDERCRKLLRVIAFMERPDYQSLSQELDMPVGSIGPTRARCLAKVRTALMNEGGGR